jgi:hypothetical protein
LWRDDLEAIADYIAQENPTRAVSFIREMRERIHAIGENPFLHRVRLELGEDARMAVVGRYAAPRPAPWFNGFIFIQYSQPLNELAYCDYYFGCRI